ncbi:MAG TPA: NlpC/P60 family protein [Actinomycetota bacterium]|jgi:hypothetical protein
MRHRILSFLVAAGVIAAVLIPAEAAFAFTDVPNTYWDYDAITYVATTNHWMQDYGTSVFNPTTLETRELVASALVKAYAPGEPTDPDITFPDLPNTDPYYPYANVAVKLGWIAPAGNGDFNPDLTMHVEVFDKAIVLAMGLTAPVAGLQHITDESGYVYPVPEYFPYEQVARTLELHFNHPTGSETMDLLPTKAIRRDEVAYSLWMAKTDPSWLIDETSHFDDVTLPTLNVGVPLQEEKRQLTTTAFAYVGYPYVYAGEWDKKTGSGYCCGAQPIGGFDCSGYVWWLLKKYEGGYNAASVRGYAGWSLPERTSTDMAKNTGSHISFGSLRIGDIMMIADNGGSTWQDVDHVGVYLGNDWMIHSTGSEDGPTLEWVGDGWYHDMFVWGRRIAS